MKLNILIIMCIVLFSLTFVSAFGFGSELTKGGEFGFPDEVVTTNYIINASNHSEYWDTNDGSLNDIDTNMLNNNGGILTIVQSWWDNLYCKLTGCTMTGNITTNEWFNGKFNWTTDDWNTFDGSTLDFNDSKLATTYYNTTQLSTVAGTIDGGSIVDTQHNDGKYDGITFNFSEESGSPALDFRFNYTDIDEFNQGVLRYKTSSLSGLYPIIQMWNYDTSIWEDYPAIAESLTFATVTQPIFDSTEHLQDGIVQMRIYKSSNGNTNNHYYVDWIAISKGYGTPSGQEVDPYSWHRNVTDSGNFATSGNVTADWINADYTNVSGLYTCSNGTATIMTRNITLANEKGCSI